MGDRYYRRVRNPVADYEHDLYLMEQRKISGFKRIMMEYFSNPGDILIYGVLEKRLIKESRAKDIHDPKAFELLLSTIIEYVFDNAPDSKLKHEPDENRQFIAKVAIECSGLGRAELVIELLLEIGRYALDIYRKYRTVATWQEFGEFILDKTLKLLRDCALIIVQWLLSAIVGYLIEGFLNTGVGNLIYISSYVIYKGIEWANSTSYDQIVRDMKQDLNNEQEKGNVIFRSIEGVETPRRRQPTRQARCCQS
jgi:hypothetical protein